MHHPVLYIYNHLHGTDTMDSVIILSGGMDSTVALYQALSLGKTVAALSFDYGAKHNHRELPMAQATCLELGIDHRIVSLDFMNALFQSDLLQSGGQVPDGPYNHEDMSKTVVPFRNGIMLSIAAGYAESIGAAELLIGSHSGDHAIYPDCRPVFNNAMDQAIREGTDSKVHISVPFVDMDKRDIGDLGRTLGVDYTKTWTCYKGGDIHCGTCGACDERKYALRHAEGFDPTSYLL